MNVPAKLSSTVAQVWGDEGRRWLQALPDIAESVARQWSLEGLAPFAHLSYHWVGFASQEGRSVVLKLGVPRPDLEREAAALRGFAGDGAARLLDQDLAQGALLIERIRPGTPLEAEWTEDRDDDATGAIARLARRLQSADPIPGLPTTEERSQALIRNPKSPFAAEALTVWQRLETTSPPARLLHGDLHHGNVLRGEEGYRAIDPHGVVGDPAHEVYAMLLNPVGASAEAKLRRLPSRLAIFAQEGGFDEARLRAWGFCGAVLSMAWDQEDGGPASPDSRAIAEALRADALAYSDAAKR